MASRTSPAGALSSTGTDMGRFMRALMNGGALDGVRILPEARLDEMTAPREATPAGYLGLVLKVAGRDTIGHGGVTSEFFSDLKIFPAQGVGVFVSRDGLGEFRSVKDFDELPDPAKVIAQRFLPGAPIAVEDSGRASRGMRAWLATTIRAGARSPPSTDFTSSYRSVSTRSTAPVMRDRFLRCGRLARAGR
jgi:CubicO group peptidase (beta-lactamase class C family)